MNNKKLKKKRVRGRHKNSTIPLEGISPMAQNLLFHFPAS
jgi:hypothetical protein